MHDHHLIELDSEETFDFSARISCVKKRSREVCWTVPRARGTNGSWRCSANALWTNVDSQFANSKTIDFMVGFAAHVMM